MATKLKVLVKATGCKPEADEDRQEYLARLIKAVLELPEDDWAKLPDEDQDWVNEGVNAIKAKKDLVDPDAEEESEEEESEEEESEEEEEEESEEEEEPAKKAKASKKKAGPAPAKKSAKKEKSKPVTMSRIDAACTVIAGLKKSTTVEGLSTLANDKYVRGGGADNPKQSRHVIDLILPAAVVFGIVTKDGDKVKPKA